MRYLKALLIPGNAVRRPQPGQSLVLVALTMFVLLGSLGIALDSGYNYGQRRAMQNAADAAALAGVNVVASSPETGGSYRVREAVEGAAQRNGVQDVNSNLDCWYIKDDLTTVKDATTGNDVACRNGSLPDGTTGVQVTVRESHQTFVMRALGITESGTAATAAAQVQLLAGYWPGPFSICGIDTALVSGDNWKGPDGQTGIFWEFGAYTSPRAGGYSGCGTSTGTCGRTRESTDGYPSVQPAPSAASEPIANYVDTSTPGNPWSPEGNNNPYYYDFSNRLAVSRDSADPLGNYIIDHDSGSSVKKGPTFLIHGPSGVATCNVTASSFKGVNETIFTRPVTFPNDENYSPPMVGTGTQIGTSMTLTPGNDASVSTSVNGPYGCQAGITAINNCVMLLPIIDNSGPGGTSPAGGEAPVEVAVRKFMYFWVQADCGNPNNCNKHTGRLIANYRALGPGQPGWRPGSTDPITIRLVK